MMMAEAVHQKQLPVKIIALDASGRCPAHAVVDELIVGSVKDPDKIRELARKSDVLTYETETTEGDILRTLEKEGKTIHPSPETLATIQDKYLQARYLSEQGIPVPAFMKVVDRESFKEGIDRFGLPLMVKARRDSYDGRGNFVLRTAQQIDEVLEIFKGRKLMMQQFIPFEKEVSVIAARNIDGEVRTYPVGENIHEHNILFKTIVPARISVQMRTLARKIAHRTLEVLHGSGVFGIEMFVTKRGEILINEIAPRVHNSGHYTIEACVTSQFEQHIRAITGMSLGIPHLTATGPVVMQNMLGKDRDYAGPYRLEAGDLLRAQRAGLHFYNKMEVRYHRKMGHFTLVSKDAGQSVEELISLADEIIDQVEYIPAKETIVDEAD